MAKIKATIKKDSPAADVIKTAKKEKQAFKEAVEAGNSKQQTAVDWIVDQMLPEGHKEMWKDMIQQAKQMEKEQIIKTANDTDNSDFWVKYESFEQYYNETFNQQ